MAHPYTGGKKSVTRECLWGSLTLDLSEKNDLNHLLYAQIMKGNHV